MKAKLLAQQSRTVRIKFKSRICIIFIFSVPSAAPGSLYRSVHASTSLTIHCDLIDCLHSNIPITGYSVRYSETGSSRRESKFAPGSKTTETTILNLEKTTMYRIEVAAVSNIGTGVYCDPVTSTTRISKH